MCSLFKCLFREVCAFDRAVTFQRIFLWALNNCLSILSVQRCRAALPSELPRSVVLLPVRLMERSSEIRGKLHVHVACAFPLRCCCTRSFNYFSRYFQHIPVIVSHLSTGYSQEKLKYTEYKQYKNMTWHDVMEK